jgi:hypothetical protein
MEIGSAFNGRRLCEKAPCEIQEDIHPNYYAAWPRTGADRRAAKMGP